jgi:hypothetical protein
MIHKYFLPFLLFIVISKECSAFSILDAGATSTQALSHLCHHLSMKSTQQSGPFGVFTHKTYKNLSTLFAALHTELINKKFTSKNAEYFCTQIDLANPKNWIFFFACTYVVYKAAAYCFGCLRRVRTKKNSHGKNEHIIVIANGIPYVLNQLKKNE